MRTSRVVAAMGAAAVSCVLGCREERALRAEQQVRAEQKLLEEMEIRFEEATREKAELQKRLDEISARLKTVEQDCGSDAGRNRSGLRSGQSPVR